MATRANRKFLGLTLVALCWIGLANYGCKETAKNVESVDPATLPQGDLADSTFMTVFDFYALEEKIDTADLAKAFQAAFADLPMWDSIPEDIGQGGRMVAYFPDAQQDFPPGDVEFLSYAAARLPLAQQQALSKARECVSLALVAPRAERWQINRRFCKFMADYSQEKALIIFDESCREFDSPVTWTARKLQHWTAEKPQIPFHIVQHAYREEDGFCRIVSIGMEKFGLPNIVINNAVCSAQNQLSSLINLMAQTLAEDSKITSPGILNLDIASLQDTIVRNQMRAEINDNASGKGIAYIRFAKKEEGDSPGPLLELYSYDAKYSNQQEYQNDFVTGIFGATDTLINTGSDNAELQAASDRAKAELPGIQERFNKGLRAQEVLLVKLPFETDEGGVEWMWVEVIEWKDDEIKGTLSNDPYYIANLKAGAAVTGDADDIFDYMIQGPNGEEGNETSKVIERM
ncbi:MAG: hypothetical protein RLZZ519_3086, partial [Bacteroidota bacterium]